MTIPAGRPSSVTSSAWRSPDEQLDRLAHRVGRWTRPGTAAPSRRRSARPAAAGSSAARRSRPRSPIEPTTERGSCAGDHRQLQTRCSCSSAIASRTRWWVSTVTSGGISPAPCFARSTSPTVRSPGALEEAVLAHPAVVVDLHRYERPPSGRTTTTSALGSSTSARDLERGVQREARTSRRPAGPRVCASRRAVRNESRSETRHVAVDDARVERLRPEVLAHALDQVRVDLVAGVDRADRVGADHLDRRVALAQVARRCR